MASQDKINWDRTTEEGQVGGGGSVHFGGWTGREQGSLSSHQLKNLILGTDSFFLAGAFASLALMSPSRASLLQP